MKFLKNSKIYLIALILSLGMYFVASQHLFQKWSWTINDVILYNQNNYPDNNIVIITIDDKSLHDNALGRWQDWKRSYYADLIQILEKNNASVIGIDVNFSEHSQNTEDDLELSRVIQKFDNIVMAQDNEGNTILPEFKRDNSSVGIAEFPVDDDQTVREAQVVYPDSPYEHFVIAILRKYLNLTEEEPFLDEKNQKYILSQAPIRVPGKNRKIQEIPLNAKNKVFINFFGPPNSYKQISFINIIKHKFDPKEIEGKIVLVGENANSLYDEKIVPISFGHPMPGVEIHANLIQTILENKFLIPQSTLQEFVMLSLVIFLVCFLFFYLTPFKATLALVAVNLGVILIWAQLASNFGRMVNIFYVLLGILLSYISIFVYRYVTVEKNRRKIEKAFEHYVSKDIVEKVTLHPEMLHLGGEKREMTAFFSDIEGFTSMSEKLQPEELVKLLNEYFNAMTKILFHYGGTLDKYEGDAIMAFWNAPTTQKDHALLACKTALKMQQHLEILRIKWEKEGKPELRVRMGINTGNMIVGNVGSVKRFDYTVMGDAVNLSSRLEGANKYYNTYLMVSESTYQLVKKEFEFRELDLIKVKGKDLAVRVYELLATKKQLSTEFKSALPHYKAGMEAYYQGKFDYALTHFNKVLEYLPQDKPTLIHVNRCQILSRQALPPDWDGSYELKNK